MESKPCRRRDCRQAGQPQPLENFPFYIDRATGIKRRSGVCRDCQNRLARRRMRRLRRLRAKQKVESQ